ncbi:MAG TPA: OB-fold nucleic acid binding domain-containing protein, partial [Desulfohalobiaceae bacterium]|nr:OB-fold nucleic acid binding domain-containing protein [Desulfohalobiaceae bacterium]
HFPVEFMAALMTSEVANTDKVMAHINACREMDIDIQPPDINKSEHPFTVEKDLVRFGLSGIKNVGDGAIQNILQERSKNGPFKSLLNFCERVNLRKVSRRVVESLIKSGAMDCFGASRASLFASLERVVSVAQKRSRSQQKGQLSLLSFVQDPKSNKSDDKNTGVGLNLQEDNVEAWPEDQKLRYEKDSLGFFLSGHPLLPYKDKLDLLEVTPLKDCLELPPETEIKAAFLVTGCKEITTRKGDKMAFCQIEDLTGRAELTLFPENYKKIKQDLHLDKPFWAKSKLNENSNGESESDEGSKTLKLVVQEIGLLYDIQIPDNQPYRVHIHSEQMGQEDWQEFKEILKRYPGNNPVQLILFLDEAVCHFQLPPEFCVSPKQRFSHEVKKWQKKVCKETTT